jgi:hypothetical protein
MVIAAGVDVNTTVDPSELVVVIVVTRVVPTGVVPPAVLLSTVVPPPPPVELTTKSKCATVILQKIPNVLRGVLRLIEIGFFQVDETPNEIDPDFVISFETVVVKGEL